MKKIRFLVLVLLATVTLAGCAVWTRVADPNVASRDNSFAVQVPVGWVRNNAMSDRIFVTRDGGFQFIEAAHRTADKAFPALKKSSASTMLPTELAEFALAELKSNKDWEALKIVSNKPASLGGKPAFRLHVSRTTSKSLRIERIIYGMADEKGFYTVAYEAPALHYLERDMAAFESVVRSFKVNG